MEFNKERFSKEIYNFRDKHNTNIFQAILDVMEEYRIKEEFEFDEYDITTLLTSSLIAELMEEQSKLNSLDENVQYKKKVYR